MNRHCHTNQFWQIVLITALAPLIAGCSLTTDVTPNDLGRQSDVNVRAPAEEIWQALANAVKARTIETTTRLAQCVLVLARNGDLSEQDVAAFDAAFPKIAAGSRPLTDVDTNVLTELGQSGK